MLVQRRFAAWESSRRERAAAAEAAARAVTARGCGGERVRVRRRRARAAAADRGGGSGAGAQSCRECQWAPAPVALRAQGGNVAPLDFSRWDEFSRRCRLRRAESLQTGGRHRLRCAFVRALRISSRSGVRSASSHAACAAASAGYGGRLKITSLRHGRRQSVTPLNCTSSLGGRGGSSAEGVAMPTQKGGRASPARVSVLAAARACAFIKSYMHCTCW